jgi:hypothetical protein
MYTGLSVTKEVGCQVCELNQTNEEDEIEKTLL